VAEKRWQGWRCWRCYSLTERKSNNTKVMRKPGFAKSDIANMATWRGYSCRAFGDGACLFDAPCIPFSTPPSTKKNSEEDNSYLFFVSFVYLVVCKEFSNE